MNNTAYKTRNVIVMSNANVKAVNTVDGRFTRKMSFRGKDEQTGEEMWFNVWPWGKTTAEQTASEEKMKNQAKYITEGRIVSFSENKFDADFSTSKGFVTDLGNRRIK